MTLGLTGSFDILQRSPHDLQPPALPEEKPDEIKAWIPSRYNVQAVAADGRLIVWNTYRGSMCVFEAEQTDVMSRLLKNRHGFERPRHGVVEYLASRGMLVEKGVDEIRQVKAAIGQYNYRTDRLELILLSSEDCNFRCRYCYEKFARGTMLPEVREGIKNLVRRRLPHLSTLRISWFGGEPLYGFDAVEDLAPFFDEVAREKELTFDSHMTTNAYLLTPDVAEKLLSWRIDSFQITIDGGPKTHDQSRPTRDGRGSFQQILANLKALKQRKQEFRVTLRTNFDRSTYPHLPEFIELMEKEFGGDDRFVFDFFPVGRWGGEKDEDLEVYDRRDVPLTELNTRARSGGLRTDSLKGNHRFASRVCYAARPYNFIIGASGNVMKCTILLDTEDYNVVGELDADGELAIDEDRLALWTALVYEEDEKCKKCLFLPTCQGRSCPLGRIRQNISPCISTRFNPKGELLEVHESETHGGKILHV